MVRLRVSWALITIRPDALCWMTALCALPALFSLELQLVRALVVPLANVLATRHRARLFPMSSSKTKAQFVFHRQTPTRSIPT